MKKHHVLSAIALTLSVAAATAHTGATGVSLERMQGMTAMADALKALAPSVLGGQELDLAQVAATAAILKSHSGAVMTDLFVEGTGGLPSQATPLVWDEPARFSALADQLGTRADALLSAGASRDDVRTAFRAIGQTCSACHEVFRINND